MIQISIQNTLSGKKEVFVPLAPGHIKMYACGVTVYDHCHIGHAMQAIIYDVVRNFLEFVGYQVTYVRNYTDIDDKIIKRAQELNMSPLALSLQMIVSTDSDLIDLGVRPATHQPKVSDHIAEIITMIEELIKKGSAYATASGDVYFRVRSKADYGKLSNRRPDDLRSGHREIVASEKEDELDFALWKKDETPDAHWSSPWGEGRPGWHIECSAMAKKYLGDTIDLHGGGRDLIFPHHENEIAQSEAANGQVFAKCWVHSGLLSIDQQKMSKSLGNHISIKKFLGEWPAEVLRLAILVHPYGSNIDFSQAIFQKSLGRLIYYYETLINLKNFGKKGTPNDETKVEIKLIETQFVKAMSDDFNTSIALAQLNKQFKQANEILKKPNLPGAQERFFAWEQVFAKIGKVLGLFQQPPEAFLSALKERFLAKNNLSEAEIEKLIKERMLARQNKDFAAGDRIRDQLKSLGIMLRDQVQGGTSWTIDLDQMN